MGGGADKKRGRGDRQGQILCGLLDMGLSVMGWRVSRREVM